MKHSRILCIENLQCLTSLKLNSTLPVLDEPFSNVSLNTILFQISAHNVHNFQALQPFHIFSNVSLKVSKFQKQIFLFSFEPKNERNYFLISALASKKGLNQRNEGSLLY